MKTILLIVSIFALSLAVPAFASGGATHHAKKKAVAHSHAKHFKAHHAKASHHKRG